MTVSSAIERQVVQRANGRCEYCRMHQSLQGATFHVEHIIPTSQGGGSELDNLAWACPGCNLHKSDRVDATDPVTGEVSRLFHPRSDCWADHFDWEDFCITGQSPIGRATGNLLRWNTERRQKIRIAEKMFGLFPPNESWTS